MTPDQQKTARLRALREARDGTPQEIKARRDAAYRAKLAALGTFLTAVNEQIRRDPEVIFQNLSRITRTATHLARR